MVIHEFNSFHSFLPSLADENIKDTMAKFEAAKKRNEEEKERLLKVGPNHTFTTFALTFSLYLICRK
jgi:hypothetical protein